jgi:hypothetical protein
MSASQLGRPMFATSAFRVLGPDLDWTMAAMLERLQWGRTTAAMASIVASMP